MDLYAYSQIGELKHYLTDNNIDIARLRGLRLMKDEEPCDVSDNIKEDKLAAAVNWLKQHSETVWDSWKDDKRHKSFIYGYDKELEKRTIVAIDFSKVHGKDRKHIKFAWKKIERAYAKQYELFNSMCGKNVLYVHARQGGGNRPYYPIDTKHPMYIADVDDAWDSTYCDIYYDLNKSKEAFYE